MVEQKRKGVLTPANRFYSLGSGNWQCQDTDYSVCQKGCAKVEIAIRLLHSLGVKIKIRWEISL